MRPASDSPRRVDMIQKKIWSNYSFFVGARGVESLRFLCKLHKIAPTAHWVIDILFKLTSLDSSVHGASNDRSFVVVGCDPDFWRFFKDIKLGLYRHFRHLQKIAGPRNLGRFL